MAIVARLIITSMLIVYSSEKHTVNKEPVTFKKRIDQLFKDFWEWRLINNPQLATKIGITKYDDRLTDLSLNAYMTRSNGVRMFLERLRDITKDVELDGNSNIALNIDLLRGDLEQYLYGMKFKPYVWPINNMEGPHTDYLNLLSMMNKNTVADMNNIITRIRLFAKQMSDMILLMREGMRLGLTMNRRSFEKLIVTYGNIASVEIEKNIFFDSFKKKPVKLTNKTWKIIVDNAKTTIRNYIRPSFIKLQAFIRDEYLTKSRPRIGVSSLPKGKDYYQGCIRYHTTTNLTAQEIHDIGLKEVARITARMEKVKRQVNFNGTLSQFREYLRTDKVFGFKNEDDILSNYRSIEKKVRQIIPKYIGRQSTFPFVISPVPKELGPTAPFAYYTLPSTDGKKPGIFSINTHLPEKRRKYKSIAIFLHEALPGHHLQIASNIQFGSPVLFRRYTGTDISYYEIPATFAGNSAYIEGWGLYSEYLGEEMGLYSDPYDLFGRLSLEMLRAARLVVDTGIHALGWSRTRAIDFIRGNTAGSLTGIRSEVDRYISWPGQACAYKIGEIKIRELRKLAENKLGNKFDLRKFHDFIISMGNIPLTVLEKQFKLYLENKLKME